MKNSKLVVYLFTVLFFIFLDVISIWLYLSGIFFLFVVSIILAIVRKKVEWITEGLFLITVIFLISGRGLLSILLLVTTLILSKVLKVVTHKTQ